MSRLRFAAIPVLLVLALIASGYGGPKRVATPTGVPLSPFEPLPIAAYEGVGVADLRKVSVRSARDVAYSQAYRFLSQDVVTVHVSRVSELLGPASETWVSPISSSASRALLVGKKFTEELRVDDTLWVRVYMAKAEVDGALVPTLQRIADDLAPVIRDAFARDLQGVTPVEEQIRILGEFQRRQGGARR